VGNIVKKYNQLNKHANKEVEDFVDFLLSKQKPGISDFPSSYKQKILQVSNWSDSGLKVFDENQKLFNQWNVQDW